jgi:glucose/mannose transport system permease protein
MPVYATMDVPPAAHLSKRRRRSASIGLTAQGLFLLAAGIFFMLPLWVLIMGSLKSMPEMRQTSILMLPLAPTQAAWKEAFRALAPSLGNSLLITLPSVVLSALLGAITGYAMTFGRIRRMHLHVFQVLVLAAFIPMQIFFYPFVLALAWMDLFGSFPAVIMVHVVLGLPLTAILFKNHFDQLPKELVRAAQIDGAGFLRTFTSVVMPLSLPMCAVVMLLQFTGIWNDFIVGLVFADSERAPMTVALYSMVGSTYGERAYNVEMAAALLTALLPLLVYFFSGKMFVRGVLSGSMKG